MSGFKNTNVKSLDVCLEITVSDKTSDKAARMFSTAIRRLLQAQNAAAEDDGSGDVVFAVFLEPHKVEQSGVLDHVVNFLVGNCQPSPVLVHVELVVPCSPLSTEPVNFATYIGQRSQWQTDAKHNADYYLGTTANKWRAVPVFGAHAARLVRDACQHSTNVKYSLFRYATAAWGLRNLARFVPDGPQDAAHCATLVARCLKAGVSGILKHPSSWYGPSSLYLELCNDMRSRSVLSDTADIKKDASLQVNRLLQESDESVASMTDDAALSAIRALTVAAASSPLENPEGATLAQKQLANALFRWSVLRHKQYRFADCTNFVPAASDATS